MKKLILCIFLFFIVFAKNVFAQLPSVFAGTNMHDVQTEETVRRYISPVRILWETPNASTHIINAEKLLKQGDGQADLSGTDLCVMHMMKKAKRVYCLILARSYKGACN